jgi:hypothetical protein
MDECYRSSESCPPDPGTGSFGTCCYKNEDGDWILQSDDCASADMKCIPPEELGIVARFTGEYVRTPCVLGGSEPRKNVQA